MQQHTDSITAIGAGVSIGGTAVSIAGFFAAYNPILIGIATIISIAVGSLTLYYKIRYKSRGNV